MENEYKQVGEYKVKEVYNENGKNLKDLLDQIFKNYCKEQIENSSQIG